MNKMLIAALAGLVILILSTGLGNRFHQASDIPVSTTDRALVNELVSGLDIAGMDTSVRPQDDLYRYMNGTWLDTTDIPANKSNFSVFSELHDNSQQAIKTIIEQAVQNPLEHGANSQKLSDFYLAFMDETRAEKLALQPLQYGLNKIASISSKNELITGLAALDRLGSKTPIGWYVTNDARQSKVNALHLVQSGLGLPDRDYYLKSDDKFVNFRLAYRQYIADMLELIGHQNAQSAADAIIALESQLAQAQWSRVKRRDADKSYNKMTAFELDELLGDDFSWPLFAEAMGFSHAEYAIVAQPSFFERAARLVTQIPLATWRDYLSFHYIDGKAELLNQATAARHFAFHSQVLRGISEPPARWKQAVYYANKHIGEILGRLYVKRHFKPEAKARVQQLVNNLIAAYRQTIDELAWMTTPTKQAAKIKLNKLTAKIGYPDQWRDYSKLVIKPDDLVGNFIRYNHWLSDKYIARIGQPVDRNEWYMTPQTVNAYYNPVNNEIVFPAAILQPPFFNMAAEDAVNYGAIGAVIGHELGHGFDDQGAKYDGDGNLTNWWSKQDQAEFNRRSEQLVKLFYQYQIFPNENINGALTLGENIGDLGGLTIALKAYQISLAGKAGIEIAGFTAEQRFFLSWAQIWRHLYREQELKRRLIIDPHSPSEYRVKGVVANIPEFYQAFDVQPSDAMYIAPEHRVKIW